ncbi:MAG: rhodanese-like domain-containing protein [Bradymonadaceae bacterium]
MARLMSSTELHRRLDDRENFTLVDIREEEEYYEGHIPHARSLPLETLKEQAEEALNKNQKVIVYGNDHDDEDSNSAAKVLESMGFRKVSNFDGGVFAWERAGFEFDTGTEG